MLLLSSLFFINLCFKQVYYLIALESKSQIKVGQGLFLVRPVSILETAIFTLFPHGGERMSKLSVSSPKGRGPTLVTFQRSHLQIPSLWELGSQHVNLEVMKTLSW